ncbi:MAG: acetylornithine deacetylase [Acidobacteriota bacterium]
MPAQRGLDSQEILRRLIAFDTTSAKSNLALVDFAAGLLDRPGVRIERFFSPEGTKANLLVELGPESTAARSGLLLSGHTDVVPALEDGWTSDPFVLTERPSSDGPRWFARGSADMKGFIALAVELASQLDIAKLVSPLALLLTYDEEVGTLGAQHFAHDWPHDRELPRLAVIGEPTSLEVVRLHKGHLKLAVTVRGAPAHSSLPHLGKNAIEAGARAVAALGALRDQLQEEHPEYGEHFPGAPFVTLNVARIAGGTAINIVPDRCVIELGIRLLPGMSSFAITERVRAALAEALADDEHTLEGIGDSPPLLCRDDAPHAEFLRQEVGQSGTRGAAYASDGGPLQALGIESVLFGPGSIEVAHRPDEFLPQVEFERAAGILRRLVHHFCETTP